MKLWAVVPIKPLALAKSRLSGVLMPQERQRFVLNLLRYNLGVLTALPHLIDGVLVVSRDEAALAAANDFKGVQTLQESGAPQLNEALHLANRLVINLGADATLILPADLPLVTREEIERLVRLGSQPNRVVIVPDRCHDGTNGLMMNPPNLIGFAFGKGSFAKHCAAGEQAGAEVLVYESERLGLDLDLPEDLVYYAELAHKFGEEMIKEI